MNLDNVHVPHRLEGESMAEYRERQHMSRRLQQRTPLISAGRQVQAPDHKKLRRKAVKQVGVRQLKKSLRAWKSTNSKKEEQQ